MQASEPNRQAFRTVETIEVREVSYCVPQILVILTVFSAACVLLGMVAADHIRTVALAMGALGCLSTAFIGAYAVFVKPELLKIERHEQKTRPTEAPQQ